METRYKIRFWIEWGGDALFWAEDEQTREAFGDRDISHIRAQQLPFSETTLAWIQRIDGWYQGLLNWDDPGAPLQWRQEECDRFNAEVRDLITAMRKELGEEYELINSEGDLVEDPDLEENLKDPEGFRRRQTGL